MQQWLQQKPHALKQVNDISYIQVESLTCP